MTGAGPQERAECDCPTPGVCAVSGCILARSPRRVRPFNTVRFLWWVAGLAVLFALAGWTGLFAATYIAPPAHWFIWFS